MAGTRLQRAAGGLVELAVGALGEPHQQRVGVLGATGGVDLQDPLVAGEHHQLAAASAGFEAVQLAAGDLRDADGSDAATGQRVAELPARRQGRQTDWSVSKR
jgi:hypothetical protein